MRFNTLQATAKDFDNTSQLAKSENFLIWEIPDGYFPKEWDQVMLTHGEHFNVLYNHHLVSVFIKNCIVQHLWIIVKKPLEYISIVITLT